MFTKRTTGFLFASVFLFASISSTAQSKISLNSNDGVKWKLKAQAEVGADSIHIYDSGYNDASWVNATVPGSVFTSFVNEKLEEDPNWGDNIYRADQSKYNRNFWYRTEFSTAVKNGERIWLNFEGINRKGEVFLNGIRLGLLDGFMHRGKFEITTLIKPGAKNVLAVLVHWPGKPVANHASPTYISSDGWDWMPSVPGLLQGITDDVYLSISGDITLQDAWVRTSVPDLNTGIVSVSVDLKNNGSAHQKAVLTGVIHPGNINFSQTVDINAGQLLSVKIDTSMVKQLLINNPKLWWPNGYGEPNLYTLDLSCTVNGMKHDLKKISFGIRQYSYDTDQGVFHISINGKRIFAKGGNWGMSEYLLRCRGEEYDLKLKLHRDMNYNIVRNWIGSVTDEEFYDACDRYGIMVWDDFWLNSHPNLPDDIMAFNKNAVEKIKRLRNHPSIAVWCGDNEGYPLPPLNGWLRGNVRTFDADDRWYQANSHSDALTGSGPWTNFHPNWYFTKYPGGFGGDPGWGFRTEIGTAVFTTFESFKKFMPIENWWPRNEMWNRHFFGESAANGGPDRYFNTINDSYGTPKGIEDFCRKAQLVNLETNKALYEGWQHHMWEDASGVMTWMSQSAYPSFVWQTYDYYYDLNGAYWGVKKACEPVHIQWSYADNSVKISNTTLQSYSGLTAQANVYNLDGKLMKKYSQSVKVNAAANNITDCFTLNFVTDNIVASKRAVGSSTSTDALDASAVADGSNGSRWSSNYSDNEWVYVDLGEPKEIASVVLEWEAAFAKEYKLQISDDTNSWQDIYHTDNGKGGSELIEFKPITTRYVRMLGIKRATQWGYSLYEMEVYGKTKKVTDLSAVHFIQLKLKDESGKLISDNFYWRSARKPDYTDLNKLPSAKLKVASILSKKDGKTVIRATVQNVGKGIALAIHVQPYDKKGERILPLLMNDNYFSLLPGESKELEISFDSSLLPNDLFDLRVEAYNR